MPPQDNQWSPATAARRAAQNPQGGPAPAYQEYGPPYAPPAPSAPSGQKKDEDAGVGHAAVQQVIAEANPYANHQVYGQSIKSALERLVPLEREMDPANKSSWIEAYQKQVTGGSAITPAEAESAYNARIKVLGQQAEPLWTRISRDSNNARIMDAASGARPRTEAEERQTEAHTKYYEAQTREKNLEADEKEANQAAGFGPVTNAQRHQMEYQLGQQRLEEKKADIDKRYKEGTLTLQEAQFEYLKEHDITKAAEHRFELSQQAELERRKSLMEAWKTETTTAEQRYATELGAEKDVRGQEVTQRGQDVSAVSNASQIAADLISKTLPFAVPPAQVAQVNEFYKQMGMPPMGTMPMSQFTGSMGYQLRDPIDLQRQGYGGSLTPANIPFTGWNTQAPASNPPPQFGPLYGGAIGSLPGPEPPVASPEEFLAGLGYGGEEEERY